MGLPVIPLPPILIYGSYVSITLALVSAIIMFAPRKVVPKLPGPVREFRFKLLSWWKRARELSVDGPFYRITVWMGRKLWRGKLSSRAQAPLTKAKATGNREVQMTLTPQLPWNPFHEETYVLSWSRQDEQEPIWREKAFDPLTDAEKVVGGRVKFFLESLPEFTPLRVRACACNARGRSEYSKAILVETLAAPSVDNGLSGPLGPAAEEGAKYWWTQTRTEVSFRIPLRPAWTTKNLKVKWTPARVEVRVDGAIDGASDEILVAPFHKKVKGDEVFWTIESEDKKYGRHLHIQLVKVDALEKWSCAIEAPGHAQLDTRMLQFFSTDDLSGTGDLSGMLAGMK